jgi:cytochrome c oxidase subunit II
MLESVVWAVSIVLMGLLVALFAWVASGANTAVGDYGQSIASAYRLRPWLFLAAIAVLVGANYKTLGELPYVSPAIAGAGDAQRVDVTGEQWSWTIEPSRVVAGRPVEFHVSAKDVNHGFAIYDPSLRIVAQTQAMPGYVNLLRYTFTEPGTYKVLCLEYCGLVHHDMKSEITVVER